MGKVNWSGFTFESKWVVNATECVICKDKVPVDEVNVNGMCEKCQEIENNLLERLAGKWADMVTEEDERRSFWGCCSKFRGNRRNRSRRVGGGNGDHN